MHQPQVYKSFKEGQKRILVATDLVGRGIDIERVNIVINYDMPETDEKKGNGADTYLHRVCRLDQSLYRIILELVLIPVRSSTAAEARRHDSVSRSPGGLQSYQFALA